MKRWILAVGVLAASVFAGIAQAQAPEPTKKPSEFKKLEEDASRDAKDVAKDADKAGKAVAADASKAGKDVDKDASKAGKAVAPMPPRPATRR